MQYQTQTQTQVPTITITDYNNINNELDNLFNKKYRKNELVVKYLYYGYTKDSVLENNCGKFILINTKNDSWKIGYTIEESIEFLQLNQTESDELIQDIQDLIQKEKFIRSQLVLTNQCPKYSYAHKLNFLNKKLNN